jgi:hypothetical protein
VTGGEAGASPPVTVGLAVLPSLVNDWVSVTVTKMALNVCVPVTTTSVLVVVVVVPPPGPEGVTVLEMLEM